jgi:serine protease Do
MKKYLLTATAALLLSGFGAMAQHKKAPEKADDKARMNEYDEIIIKRKDPSKDSKVTIEIKGDEVLVDGRPLDDYVNDDVSVRLHNMKKYKLGPSSQFRYNGGNWMLDDDNMPGGDIPFLGVMTEGSSDGAKVEEVSKNSAADKAGLKEGDVITKVNDKKVYDPEGLSDVIRKMKPDDKVTITYKRDGRESTATATLGKRKMPVPIPPHAPIAPVPPMGFNFDGGAFDGRGFHRFFNIDGERPRLGVKVQDTEDGKGVKVLDVDDGSAADKGGIKDDDVITRFNDKDVNSAEDLADALSDAKDKGSFKVELQRNGKPQTIEIKVPKKLKTANL